MSKLFLFNKISGNCSPSTLDRYIYSSVFPGQELTTGSNLPEELETATGISVFVNKVLFVHTMPGAKCD